MRRPESEGWAGIGRRGRGAAVRPSPAFVTVHCYLPSTFSTLSPPGHPISASLCCLPTCLPQIPGARLRLQSPLGTPKGGFLLTFRPAGGGQADDTAEGAAQQQQLPGVLL